MSRSTLLTIDQDQRGRARRLLRELGTCEVLGQGYGAGSTTWQLCLVHELEPAELATRLVGAGLRDGSVTARYLTAAEEGGAA